MIHDEHRKFSIEYKKFYYDLHGKISKLCFTFLVVPAAAAAAIPPLPSLSAAPASSSADTGGALRAMMLLMLLAEMLNARLLDARVEEVAAAMDWRRTDCARLTRPTKVIVLSGRRSTTAPDDSLTKRTSLEVRIMRRGCHTVTES